MKRARKLGALLMCLCMVLMVTPAMAFAATLPYITIGGTQVTEQNKDNVLGDNTVSVSYDDTALRWVITLNNADIAVTGSQIGIYARASNETIELRLNGTNRITSENRSALDFTWCDGIITGSGTLELISSGDSAVSASSSNGFGGNVTISGVSSFKATGLYKAIGVVGALTIENTTAEMSSTANPNYNNAVVDADRDMNFTGSKITVDADRTDTYGISVRSLTVNDTELSVQADNLNGIFAQSDIVFENGALVTVTSDYPAIYGGGSKININGSRVEATSSGSNGIYTSGNIEIENDANVIAKGYYPGLFSDGDISIDNSSVVSESSDDYGLWSNGGLSISGDSEVTASGPVSSLGAVDYIKVSPDGDALLEVKAGTSSADAVHFENSPFGAETDLLNLSDNGKYIEDYTYFHSMTHVHDGTATCHSKAVCSDCGQEYGEVDPDNHDGGTEIRNKVDATETQDGYTGDTYCLGCGVQIASGTVIPKQEHTHSYGDEWKSNDTSHWHECECGQKADETDHSFKWVTDKEATATETGSKHEECEVCGYKKDAVEIPLVGHTHSYSAEWKFDATNHWHECACGEKSDTAAHTYGDWTVTKAAKSTTAGSRERTCTVCGYKMTESLPATGTSNTNNTNNTNSPQTGDNSNIVLWIALLALAGCGLTGTVLYSVKRRTH